MPANTEFLLITDQGIQPIFDMVLVSGDDPILKEKIPLYSFKEDTLAIANALVKALQDFKGLGLSANQVGLRHRVFVAGTEDQIVAYFNPEIVWTSPETELNEEGCLSYPGLRIKIRRPIYIKLQYQDYNGIKREMACGGLTARIIQHEIDHLDGITFQGRAGPMALSMAKKKWRKQK